MGWIDNNNLCFVWCGAEMLCVLYADESNQLLAMSMLNVKHSNDSLLVTLSFFSSIFSPYSSSRTKFVSVVEGFSVFYSVLVARKTYILFVCLSFFFSSYFFFASLSISLFCSVSFALSVGWLYSIALALFFPFSVIHVNIEYLSLLAAA